MNSLYNKIYEAVNTGIQKALIIDNGQESDTSIKWGNKKINNGNNMLAYYVSLLNTNNANEIRDVYQNIISFHKENPDKLYTVNDIQELSDIYRHLDCVEWFTGHKIDLSWINTANTVLLIADDETEMPLHSVNDIDKVIFIKFIDKLNNRNYILHKDLKASNDILWTKRYLKVQPLYSSDYINEHNCKCSYTDVYSIAEQYYDGYEHTYKLFSDDNKFPAINYAVKQSTDNYAGYLPALGELCFLRNHSNLVQYMINIASGNKTEKNKNFINNFQWLWSSTEYSQEKAWRLLGHSTDILEKQLSGGIALPFFKKKHQ